MAQAQMARRQGLHAEAKTAALCCAVVSSRSPQPSSLYLFTALPTPVAQQTCSLLYRRFVTCGSSAKSRVLGVTDAWPITNRRYLPAPRLRQAGGRLKICATVNRYSPFGRG